MSFYLCMHVQDRHIVKPLQDLIIMMFVLAGALVD